MKEKLLVLLSRWWVLLVLICLLPVYWLIAVNNERSVDYVNNGFFTFWLSGHMVWTGEQQYNSTVWVNGHHINGATWIPNKIFPYPLPLALITAPLGLLPIGEAYIVWDILAQFMIAGCILYLAKCWEGINKQLYAVFILIATILNGNIYLGLMTGTFSAMFLLFLTLSFYFFSVKKPILAGMMLAGLAFKPPLLTITILIGLWLLIQRNWKAIGGIVIAGISILLVGFIQDDHWLQKFRGAGENLLSMRIGNQPTILSYSRLFCRGDMNCAFSFYLFIVATLILLFFIIIWKHKIHLTTLQVYCLAIPFGVLIPPYIWSYDYALLIIPICYISFDIIRRKESYIISTIYLLLLDVLSIFGLMMFWMSPESNSFTIQRDMWSIWVAVFVLISSSFLVLNHRVFTIQNKTLEVIDDSL